MKQPFGKLLIVDLTCGTVDFREINPAFLRRWVGGRSLNAARLFKQLPDPSDPLEADNILLFSCGLLTGTAAPSATRLHVNAVSPLTGFLGSSNVGGHFGVWLRSSGYQTIEIRGRASQPVYLDIDHQGARLEDAGALWGLDTHETHDRLARITDAEAIQTLTIGPAGEHLTRFACIVADYDHAAGRTGMGAVMGAKQLKAIVVRKPPYGKRLTGAKTARSAIADYVRQITRSPDFRWFSELGGAGYVRWADTRGLTAARNYRQNRFEASESLDGIHLKEAHVRSRGCSRCPVQCKAVLKFAEGRLKDQAVFRPEFEPMINIGAKCGLGDAQATVYLDNLCTRLGLDSTSAGTAIAFAMDIADRGILPRKWSGGLDLSWGNSDTMEVLLRQMAAMEDLGGLLGLGVQRAARRLGPDAETFAAHVKGLELTAYHPSALLGSALGYAISSRGGDYNNVYASLEHRWTPEQAFNVFGTPKALDPKSYEGKGRLVHRAVLVNIVMDSLGICKVPALSLIGTFDLENEARLMSTLTGWDFDANDLFAVGQSTAVVERLINLRLGMETTQDDLPEMFFSGKGPTLNRSRFNKMVGDFYKAMGWDRTGRPRREITREIENALTESIDGQ